MYIYSILNVTYCELSYIQKALSAMKGFLCDRHGSGTRFVVELTEMWCFARASGLFIRMDFFINGLGCLIDRHVVFGLLSGTGYHFEYERIFYAPTPYHIVLANLKGMTDGSIIKIV